MRGRWSTKLPLLNPIKKGKKFKRRSTPHLTALMEYGVDLSLVQNNLSFVKKAPEAKQKTSFALSARSRFICGKISIMKN